MPITGEYEPSPRRWVRDQVELFEGSGGTQGTTLLDTAMPVVIVTNIGAKTGKVRKTPLMRVEHDGRYAAVASLGGAPKNPVWYYNLRANPRVELQDGQKRTEMIAATASDTIRSRSRTGKPSRQLRSDWTAAWEGDKSPGALPMPLQSLLSEPVMRRIDVLAEQGNKGARELATYWVGQGVGLMNKATTVRDVIYEMAQDFAEAAERLNQAMSD